MSSELVEVTVERIAAGGDGIGRLESGRIVFVPRTAPGDRVLARLTENRTRWSRGQLVELKATGSGRVDPPCPHYAACGGCGIQHLDPPTQARALQDAVEDALWRIGGVSVPVRAIEPAKQRFEYRNRVTHTLRRTPGLEAGYHGRRGRTLVDIEACPLAEPAVQQAWRDLREGWGDAARHLPRGRELRLTLRASESGRTALWVEGGTSPGAPEQIMQAVTTLDSYGWGPTGGPPRHLAGSLHLVDEWDGLRIALRHGAFLQVNRAVARDLDAHLDAELGAVAGLRMLDLYAGVGLRAVRGARAGARVVSVECETGAYETGRDLARAANVEVDARLGAVEDLLDELPPADVVLVNPPRAGLDACVVEALCRSEAQRLVYVSCDPGTLARDVRRLAPSWTAELAQPFDAFPQTGHVETVLWLRRGGL